MARGARDRGKRIAFGDGQRIIWDHHSETIFRNNPNIAKLGSERDADIEWVPFYRGNRIYNTKGNSRWIWKYEFRPTPGEIYFSDDEHDFAASVGSGFVAIEPNVPRYKTVSPNKQWPFLRFNKVARLLEKSGRQVIQFKSGAGGHEIPGLMQIKTPTFRHALAALSKASLFIGAEGGLHHGAAAVGIPGVVLFGGFIPPAVTGYDAHTNLTGGAEACGSWNACGHCHKAMEAISVPQVMDAAHRHLKA